MRKILGFLIFMGVFLTGCASIKTLPQDNMLYIKELSLIKGIKDSGNKFLKLPFKTGVEKNPVLYLVLGNAEGRNEVEIRVYFKGKLVRKYTLSFGEEGKYYKRVIMWRMLEVKEKGEYQVVVFHNGTFLISKKFNIGNKVKKAK